MRPLEQAYQLEILRDDGRALYILVDQETAERELNAWQAQERRWADAIAEYERAQDYGFSPLGQEDDQGPRFDPIELYVRRLTGLTIDGRHETTIAYRFQEVSGMQVTRVA